MHDGAALGFLAPMPSELQPLRRRLGLRADGTGPEATHLGVHGDRPVVALLTGIGMGRAEQRARLLIEHHPVGHVVVVGVAGGIGADLAVGDVVVPEVVVDRRDGRELVPTSVGAIAAAGMLLSGDDLVKDPTELARLRDGGAHAIDMETAAIGRVCEDAGVPWSVFRAVSDDAFDPQVDGRILALTRPDGSPDLVAVARYVGRDPRRVRLLSRLGRDLRRATTAAADAAVAATGAP